MLFNSLIFLAFAAIFFSVWPLVKKHVLLRCWWIVAASFVFYGWWDWRFLLLILASGFIDFFAALGIDAYPARKRWLLALSLAGNIGSLAVFKYLDFFIGNFNSLAVFVGMDSELPLSNWILPVGISFYTFQSMSYTIDVYRGELKPTRNIGQFFAYLAMFPQLVAGPIVRARDLLPSLAREIQQKPDDQWIGLRWIVLGYFKKMVVADTLAPVVDAAFASESMVPSGSYWWVVVMMFSLQIYCDFSGYSDIARGLGKWMGFDFPENFNHPYIARGFQDFWLRWHISLSTWFRDYVYVPLGGSRCGSHRSHVNMWATMLLSGFWHGASWTFVVWGALHAFYLSVERWTRWPARMARVPYLGNVAAATLTYALVCVSWVFFRSEDFGQALSILAVMFNPASFDWSYCKFAFRWKEWAVLPVMFAWELFFFLRGNEWRLLKRPWFTYVQIVALAVIVLVTVLFRGPGQAFVYFQF